MCVNLVSFVKWITLDCLSLDNVWLRIDALECKCLLTRFQCKTAVEVNTEEFRPGDLLSQPRQQNLMELCLVVAFMQGMQQWYSEDEARMVKYLHADHSKSSDHKVLSLVSALVGTLPGIHGLYEPERRCAAACGTSLIERWGPTAQKGFSAALSQQYPLLSSGARCSPPWEPHPRLMDDYTVFVQRCLTLVKVYFCLIITNHVLILWLSHQSMIFLYGHQEKLLFVFLKSQCSFTPSLEKLDL